MNIKSSEPYIMTIKYSKKALKRQKNFLYTFPWLDPANIDMKSTGSPSGKIGPITSPQRVILALADPATYRL